MTGMARWVLFEEVREAQAEQLRLNGMRGRWLKLGQQSHPGMSRPPWNPAVDISERKDAYVVAAELPGVGIDDLDITFEDGLLTLEGTRRAAPTLAEERIHQVERNYGHFRRSITLPTHVKPEAIEASTQDGVLQIMVPKAEEVPAQRIQVRVGGHAITAGEEEGVNRG
jgi:HSP20 family protein